MKKKNISNVILLEKVDDLTKVKLYKSADYFLMPNIEIEWDIEGFGLVLLEAQHYSLKTFASYVDWAKDFFSNNTYFLPPQSVSKWVSTINNTFYE